MKIMGTQKYAALYIFTTSYIEEIRAKSKAACKFPQARCAGGSAEGDWVAPPPFRK